MKDVLKCSADSSIFIMKTALWQLADIMPTTRSGHQRQQCVEQSAKRPEEPRSSTVVYTPLYTIIKKVWRAVDHCVKRFLQMTENCPKRQASYQHNKRFEHQEKHYLNHMYYYESVSRCRVSACMQRKHFTELCVLSSSRKHITSCVHIILLWWSCHNRARACIRKSWYSSHVIGERLLVVGGVWLLSDGVPGVLMINLSSLCSVEFRLETSSVSWPLVLHSFCSELTDSIDQKLLLIGGGGNCFSFGTHLNLQPVTLDLRATLG
ncbi:uncharacterized protein LOC117561511 isoform X2 [Gymnodraco acuticeps]|uniref:Uncharacterized protein LOC117553479 isoform X2 n=1 Tax=Gymnodraco acuticeps TaxID=8218 RepID=A0A6P8X4H7_GYMAC|nr:uncharacterized protein LOC117553479 isoform X2 [Gymnodraco acuticeps]XP_034094892.1 uncharacterized protein LOC117561511 isoform X2 [Gymnodraco acuticeps]